MARLLLFAVAIVLVIGIGLLGWLLWQDEIVITVDQQQLQERLAEHFPLERSYYMVVDLELSNPRLELQDGTDRLRFATDAIVELPVGSRYSGSATMSGSIDYDAEQKAFLLTDARIESLDVGGVPANALEKARQAASVLASEVLDRVPVYRLDDETLTQQATRLLLKDVTVEDGQLRIVLGHGRSQPQRELASTTTGN